MAQNAWMVPLDLDDSYTSWFVHKVLSNRKRGIGWLTVRRALIERDTGFWGNDSRSPSSIVYVREGDHELEAFGLLGPRSAIRWLVGLGRPVALMAPDSWSRSIRLRAGAFDWGEVASWMPGFYRRPHRPCTLSRRLKPADAEAFTEAAPEWALRCWPGFDVMIRRGCAMGVPFGNGFASLAWVLDQTESFDAIGVYTAPRYRQLGLARAAAAALIEHIISGRRKIPLWATSTMNVASQALAGSLGLTPRIFENVFRWPPHVAAPKTVAEATASAPSWISVDGR